MEIIRAAPGDRLNIGRKGEHLARQVQFDLTTWAETYGEGRAELFYQRPGDLHAYPIAAQRQGNLLLWDITRVDTAQAGKNGRAEIRYYVEDVLVILEISYILVEQTLDITEKIPVMPKADWFEQVLEQVRRVEAPVTSPPIINDETGTWMIYDRETGQYENTGYPATGRDGIDGKDGLNGRDGAQGPTGPTGPQGERGPRGYDGEDGESDYIESVSYQRSNADGGENVITLHTSLGRSYDFRVRNGSKGSAGKDGSDANVTAENITAALGYTPANEANLNTEQPADYVVAEASAVVDKVISREGANPFRFIAFADAHQKNDDADISNGNRDAGHGMAEILKQIGVDFITFLGDAAWGAYANTTEEVREQLKTFNRCFASAFKGENQLRIEGNHDDANYSTIEVNGVAASTEKLPASAVHAFFYSYNKDVVFDPEHITDGYCYRDFPNHKIRVICLNTNQGTEDGGVMEGYQLKWFAETALDMTEKADWNVMILSHHPLDYGAATLFKDAAHILDCFIKGIALSFTTTNGAVIDINYAGKNCAFIANFHGHAHSFSVVQMQKYRDNAYMDMDALAICIPNACFSRNNQYIGNESERLARYSTETTYNKTAGTTESTSFNVVTVCTDTQMIYLDVYGAGIDREVTYRFGVSYTNQLPISTDTDGSIYNGVGYKEDMYLSNGVPTARDGIVCSGFIPIGIGSSEMATGEQVIYMSGITVPEANTLRIAFYEADKTFYTTLYGHQLASVAPEEYGIPIPYTVDDSGNVTMIDLSALTHHFSTVNLKDIAYIRICCPNIDGDSIITVNEPITQGE